MMPLNPAPVKMSIDYGQMQRLQMPFKPDVVIAPSDLAPFARQVDLKLNDDQVRIKLNQVESNMGYLVATWVPPPLKMKLCVPLFYR